MAPGDRVAIVGAGPIGLAALQTVALLSPRATYVLDINDARLQVRGAAPGSLFNVLPRPYPCLIDFCAVVVSHGQTSRFAVLQMAAPQCGAFSASIACQKVCVHDCNTLPCRFNVLWKESDKRVEG